MFNICKALFIRPINMAFNAISQHTYEDLMARKCATVHQLGNTDIITEFKML